MNKIRRRLSAVWVMGLFLAQGQWQQLQAQDLQFSQFFNAPLLVNPANTGFLPDADYRLGDRKSVV